jgi:hypothetical protein
MPVVAATNRFVHIHDDADAPVDSPFSNRVLDQPKPLFSLHGLVDRMLSIYL